MRRSASLGVVALLLSVLFACSFTRSALPAAQARVAPGDVQLSVLDVTPNSPQLSHQAQPLEVTLQITNKTAQTLPDVELGAVRSDPIATQKQLDAEIAKPTPPSSDQAFQLPAQKVGTVAGRATVDVVYRITTDIPQDADLCLCANAIYPLYFTLTATSAAGAVSQLAVAQTYLPSFLAQPAKAQVGWMWPLLDRPHRSLSGTTFLDDELADEVSPGGRLDRLLRVVELVAESHVGMTLVTDPELIDELAVMSGPGGYSVNTAHGTAKGTRGAVAGAWLSRLRAVLATAPIELSFTPAGDPSVESLHRHGLGFSAGLNAAAENQVVTALGGRTPVSDIAWPADEQLSSATLSTLVAQGTHTVVVRDRSVVGGARPNTSDALTAVTTAHGAATVAVTSSVLEKWVAAVLQSPTARGHGTSALPQLVAELALRVVQSLDHSHYVLLTPPRTLDPQDPALAARAVLATSVSTWSGSLPLRAATQQVTASDHSRLRGSVPAQALPDATADSAHYLADTLPKLPELFVTSPNVAAPAIVQQLAAYPLAIQRSESATLLSTAAGRERSAKLARQLRTRIERGILAKVHLVQPSNGGSRGIGTYTLTSKDSNLPITIENQLNATVQVHIAVDTGSGPVGFRADARTVTIPPNRKVQLHLRTHVDRLGPFDVHVSLATTGGLQVGTPIQLQVRSTALGTIGVVITVVAAVVLVLALLLRGMRRVMRRRRPAAPPKPDPAQLSPASS